MEDEKPERKISLGISETELRSSMMRADPQYARDAMAAMGMRAGIRISELQREIAALKELVKIATSIFQDGENIIAFPNTDFMKVKAHALDFLSDPRVQAILKEGK